MSEPGSYLTLRRGTPVVDRFGVPVVGRTDDLLDAHELGDRCEAAYEATTLDELQRLVPERD